MIYNDLKNSHPKLFRKLRESIECEVGWFNLIKELCEKIERISCHLSDDEYPAVAQIKEKFGGLRFYIDPVPSHVFDAIMAAISDAEAKSFSICEFCGKTGSDVGIRQKYGGSWLKTACADEKWGDLDD